jgi:alkanesulfonate monooxygenase SsuD/methylene tetrahydromethanopterin reductase-like flavin-dependent oxidoreductase (luciferase family)
VDDATGHLRKPLCVSSWCPRLISSASPRRAGGQSSLSDVRDGITAMTDTTVGVVLTPKSPPERLREVAQAAEAAGIDQLWLWEDCFFEGGLTAATAALACTERLKVGVGLLPVPLRNPALAAMEIATIARLFPGRFRPGVGHGVLEWMEQVGARVASPMTLLREYTTAVRDLLHGRTVDVDGRYVHLRDVTLDWPPAEVPPVLVGGRGPKTVRLAGEVGDGVILDAGGTLDRARDVFATTAEGRAAAGRTGEPFDNVVFVELDTSAPDLATRMDESISALSGAGADTVVFQPALDAPDPEPLIEACARRG